MLENFIVTPGEKPLDKLKPDCGFASIFKSVGVIGDSLASGEFESRDDGGNTCYHDMYEYSWPSVLARITGSRYQNYSRGGMTAREYVQSWADANGFWQPQQCYIIALGNNDSFVFNHPLGSPADISVGSPQSNADTFFGNMGRIIEKYRQLSPRSVIFLVSPQLRGEPCDAVIRSISCGLGELSKMYGSMYLIDMTTYGPVYDQKMRADFALGFHPNAMGYHAYALMIGNYIDYIIRSNPALFAEVPFIGTDLKYNK